MTMFYTDLYQMSMALAHIEKGTHKTPVVCEAFFRSLPKKRSFLVLSGINRALEFIDNMRFTNQEIRYLKEHSYFKNIKPETFDFLKSFKFSGKIKVAPEGTIMFPNVPFFQVECEAWQAPLLETVVLSIVNHSTVVSSKAARIVKAANGIPVIELGTRRTHELAAVDAAYAGYIAGVSGTSNVEAGLRYGIPTIGTMSHMWVMSHRSEQQSYENFLSVFDNSTLLVDTYDIIKGVKLAMKAAQSYPKKLSHVRIDSDLFDKHGTPTGICHKVRNVLDSDCNFKHVKIVISDDLNEYKIMNLINAREPVDAFGVGTELVESKDAPTLSGVYKLVEVNGKPVYKKSTSKKSFPGKHHVHRVILREGDFRIMDRLRFVSSSGVNLLMDAKYCECSTDITRNNVKYALDSMSFGQVFQNNKLHEFSCDPLTEEVLIGDR